MGYKEILVYLDPTPASDDRLRVAIDLANAHGARLVGSTPVAMTRSSVSGNRRPSRSARASSEPSATPASRANSSPSKTPAMSPAST